MGCQTSKANGKTDSFSSVFRSFRSGFFSRKDFAFENKYEQEKLIGEGLTSNVYLVSSKENPSELYAMKQLVDDLVDADTIAQMKREFRALQTCKHPNIVRVYSMYGTDGVEEMSIVMELCSGGSLKRLELPLSEAQTKHIVRQVLRALDYLHNIKGLAHRDLALEHILLANDENDEGDLENCIKLCDFGLVKTIRDGKKFQSNVGDPFYLCPEALSVDPRQASSRSGYTEKADMWSVGVITYELLSGGLPFAAESLDEYVNNAKRCDYNSDRNSDRANDFIRHLLQKDPKRRFNPKEALAHPWLAK